MLYWFRVHTPWSDKHNLLSEHPVSPAAILSPHENGDLVACRHVSQPHDADAGNEERGFIQALWDLQQWGTPHLKVHLLSKMKMKDRVQSPCSHLK